MKPEEVTMEDFNRNRRIHKEWQDKNRGRELVKKPLLVSPNVLGSNRKAKDVCDQRSENAILAAKCYPRKRGVKQRSVSSAGGIKSMV